MRNLRLVVWSFIWEDNIASRTKYVAETTGLKIGKFNDESIQNTVIEINKIISKSKLVLFIILLNIEIIITTGITKYMIPKTPNSAIIWIKSLWAW